MINVFHGEALMAASHEINLEVSDDIQDGVLDSTEFWLNERLDDFVTAVVFHQAVKDIRERENRVPTRRRGER